MPGAPPPIGKVGGMSHLRRVRVNLSGVRVNPGGNCSSDGRATWLMKCQRLLAD